MIFFVGRISFVILIVFLIALLLQLLYIWIVFGKTAFYKPQKPSSVSSFDPVSVVVCSSDSLHYLQSLVPAILEQDYPDFEVVIVNNCSTDDTEMYLKELERNEKRVKIVQLHQQLNFFKGKKFPLSMGIKSAQHDILVFTDPECLPDNNGWLRSIVGGYGNNTEITIGYCYRKPKGGILDKMARYVEFVEGMNYMSFALLGRPYSASGKCLSYRKSLFYKNKGFTSHYTVSAGDDSLFVNDNANKKNTSVVIEPDHAIGAEPVGSLSRWIIKRSYRYSVIPHYDIVTKLLLSINPVTTFLFYASFLAMIFLDPAFEVAALPVLYLPILALLFVIRLVSQCVVFTKSSEKLVEKGLAPWVLLGDVFYMILNPIMVIMGIVGKGAKWND